MLKNIKTIINKLQDGLYKRDIEFYGLILGKKKNIKMDIFDDFWVFSEKRLVKK